MTYRQILLLALFFSIGTALGLSVTPGLAHGDPHSIAVEQELGPYKVTVFSSSNVNDQTHLHLSALINLPKTNMPVLTTKVYFHIAPIHSGGHVGENILVVEAGQANPYNGFMHEANLILPAVGQYEITTIVRDFAGQGGQVSFDMNVQAVTIWTKIVVVAFLAQALMALIWIIKEGFIVWTRDFDTQKKTFSKGVSS
jgi:hypothetical protein